MTSAKVSSISTEDRRVQKLLFDSAVEKTNQKSTKLSV